MAQETAKRLARNFNAAFRGSYVPSAYQSATDAIEAALKERDERATKADGDVERYAPRPWRRRPGTSIVEDANGRDVLIVVGKINSGQLEGKRAQAIMTAVTS